ncbi:MAG: hypothetical protein IKU00_10140 [Bacteroidales bacterium]|nr:hypothetical protein [Bacteroidales bacterium]
MIGNATLNCNEPYLDEILVAQLRNVFAAEKSKPGKSVMSFILGYAASYESIENEMIGTMGFMKN